MPRRIDFGRAAADYGRHRQGFPAQFFERLARHGIGIPDQRVLDLGTGTGQMARGLAARGADVTGLDPAPALLEQARELDGAAGVRIRYLEGTAEETGLPARAFEVVTAAQCWHWFDRPRVLSEVRRLLVPGGWLVLAYLDWLPRSGSVVAATEELILGHNPAWDLAGMDGFHTEYVRDLEEHRFEGLETFSYDLDLLYTHLAWRGRIRASAGVGASLSPVAVEAFDRDHAELLAARFPEDPLRVPHRIFVLLGRT